MSTIFNTFLYQPILQTLIFIYETAAFHNFGFAVILLTLLVRIVLFPLFYAQTESHLKIQRLQPKIKKIQAEHKEDKRKQGEELIKLWKEHKINPAASFIMLLIQLPVLIAIYKVILQELSNSSFDNFTFLGFIDLGQASVLAAVFASVLQYIQIKTGQITLPQSGKSSGEDPAERMNRMMLLIAPAITFIILLRLPAALGLYWIASTAFSIGQQYIINKRIQNSETSNSFLIPKT